MQNFTIFSSSLRETYCLRHYQQNLTRPQRPRRQWPAKGDGDSLKGGRRGKEAEVEDEDENSDEQTLPDLDVSEANLFSEEENTTSADRPKLEPAV